MNTIPQKSSEITPDEIMIVCMARQIKDGDVVAQGIATPMVTAAYLLARHTHAPNLYFMSAIGQGICREPAPLSITQIEKLWLEKSLTNIGFVRASLEGLPTLTPKEFFRPAQMNQSGNFNNIAFGKNYRKPRLRLPGTGGIPDVTTYSSNIYLYVPRHSKITFVETLDFHSGLVYKPNESQFEGPKFLVTDLGQFDFIQNKMRLISLHPGISLKEVQLKTGFNFEVPENLSTTQLPTKEELYYLRQVVDPLNSRKLEMLRGSKRKELLRRIIINENAHEK